MLKLYRHTCIVKMAFPVPGRGAAVTRHTSHGHRTCTAVHRTGHRDWPSGDSELGLFDAHIPRLRGTQRSGPECRDLRGEDLTPEC